MTSLEKQATKCYELVADALVRIGATCIFGVMGEDNAPLVIACVERGIAYHPARHENIAVAMADGYFRGTGRIGFALVTGGPGFTNCLTALNTAMRAGSSVVLLCGGSSQKEDSHDPSLIRKVDRVAWLKHFPTSSVLREMGVPCFKPSSPEDAVAVTCSAVSKARNGTVVLFLGKHLLHAPVGKELETTPLPQAASAHGPEQNSITEIADLLQETWAVQRPLILAGRGALKSDAAKVLARLGELTGALLATTLPVKGFFHGYKYAIGVCGTYSTSVASSLITQVDCVLSFGASLNRYTSYNNAYFPKAHIIQVDSSENALARFMDTAISLQADVRLAAEALVAELERRGHRATGFRTPEIEHELESYSKKDGIVDKSTSTHVDPRTLILEIDKLLPSDRIVCLDSGHQARFPNSLMEITGPRNFMQLGDAGSIGLGMGGAIGAQLGRAKDLVAFFTGDGAFAMSLGDLETIVRLKLPMLVVVLNDQGFGAEVNYLGDMGLPTQLARIPTPSFADIAVAMGAEGATIRRISELDVVAKWLAKGHKEPLLLDCRVNTEIRAAN